jgi:2-polyprenyl-6-methoxyphenol hydroxylase-like FAD-dependent oxidoreductase
LVSSIPARCSATRHDTGRHRTTPDDTGRHRTTPDDTGEELGVQTEVLIVGAGPSGLVLANVLARGGVACRIVDRKPGPVRESRAAIVHVRTLELLDRLGLAGRAVERGVPTTRVEVYERGRRAAAFPLAGRGAAGRTPFPYALVLEQDRTERLLAEGLAEHGARVEWDTALVGLTAGGDAVQARIRGPDGREETVSARWAVGADGARSPVRRALGLGFAGSTYEQTGLLADVEVDAPAAAGLAPGTIRLTLTRGGFVGMAALSSGRYRLFGAVPAHLATISARSTGAGTGGDVSHEAYATVSLAALQRWLDESFAVDARLTGAAWTALFRIHSRLAERFRRGAVFLVGDAAHLHSPAGGQGMNLGIGDAFNLGWKLALVAQGRADAGLLDSYEAERLPVALTVLRYADRGFWLEATSNPVATWMRASLAPHLVGPLLRLSAVQGLIFRLFSQTWITYRGSPAVAGGGRASAGPRPGDRAPYGPFERGGAEDAGSVFDLIGGTGHSLLLFEGPRPDPALDAYRRAVEAVVGRSALAAPVHVIPSRERTLHRRYGAREARLFLIRPDGHVAYAGALEELGGLAGYLDRLYGRPGAATAAPPGTPRDGGA